MQTLNQLPEEAQMTIARKLGYDGKKDGFPAYLMSNRRIADRYTQLENAFQAQQRRTTGMSESGMAEGGYMMERFAQNQQQDMVGGYVPPPKQSFANGGTPVNVTPTPTVPNQPAVYDPNATIGDISTQMTVAPALPQGAEVQTVATTPATEQMLQSGVGQVSGQVALPTAQAGTATATPQVQEDIRACLTLDSSKSTASWHTVSSTFNRPNLHYSVRSKSTTVADMRFAKPLDTALIEKAMREHEVGLTIEEGAIGGIGAHVLTYASDSGLLDEGLKVRTMRLPDIFQDQDDPKKQYDEAGLNAPDIVDTVLAALRHNSAGVEEARA